MNEKKEIETVDGVPELLPEQTGSIALPTNKESVQDILFLAENVEKIIAAQNKIRFATLKLSQAGDWTMFGKGDKAKVEIGFAGTMRIASTFGINFINFESEKEIGTDDIGEWYRWNVECDAIWKNRLVRVFGRYGSRDKLLGRQDGKYKPLHDIDEGNIKIAARRGAMKEGVKVLFGLHHMNPADLTKHGVKFDSASGYVFKDKETQQSEATITIQESEIVVESMTKKVSPPTAAKKWVKYTVNAVDGSAYSTFSDTDAETLREFKESGNKVKIQWKETKFGREITKI